MVYKDVQDDEGDAQTMSIEHEDGVSWSDLPCDLWRYEIAPRCTLGDRLRMMATCTTLRTALCLLQAIPETRGVTARWVRSCLGTRPPPWVAGFRRWKRSLPPGVVEVRVGLRLYNSMFAIVFVRADGCVSMLVHAAPGSPGKEYSVWVANGYCTSVRWNTETGWRESSEDPVLLQLQQGPCAALVRRVRHAANFWVRKMVQDVLPALGEVACIETPYIDIDLRTDTRRQPIWQLSTGDFDTPRMWRIEWKDKVSWTFPNACPTPWEALLTEYWGFTSAGASG